MSNDLLGNGLFLYGKGAISRGLFFTTVEEVAKSGKGFVKMMGVQSVSIPMEVANVVCLTTHTIEHWRQEPKRRPNASPSLLSKDHTPPERIVENFMRRVKPPSSGHHIAEFLAQETTI